MHGDCLFSSDPGMITICLSGAPEGDTDVSNYDVVLGPQVTNSRVYVSCAHATEMIVSCVPVIGL